MRLFVMLLMCCCTVSLKAQECDSIHEFVEKTAEFPGGQAEMMQWLLSNIHVPTSDKASELTSTLLFSFVVEKDGRINQIRVLRSIDPETDRYLAGIIKSMPRWQPAIHEGKVVRSRYSLPLHLHLNQ